MLKPLETWIVDENWRIGKGGFSKVYRCKKTNGTEHYGAIKVFERNTAVNTYEKEVKALEVLRFAPNSPRMLDHGRDSKGRLCIVTELVHGRSLNVHLREKGPLTLAQTLKLLADMLSVLHHAHGEGLVHMDVQAPNVLVGDNGNFSLVDWGTSRRSDTIRVETIKANKDVVAPECFYGCFSAATDFYSLAWLVVYALTGKLPYHCGEVEDKAYRTLAHCLEKPVLPSCIPEQLQPVLYNWLSKDPDNRCIEYDLGALMDTASGDEAAFIEYKDIRQLEHEFSCLHYGARQDIPYAQYQYAMKLLKEDRTDEAIYWLERAYQLRHAKAAYHLAMALEDQNPGHADVERIRELLEFAARRQITRAQYELAMRLLAGKYADEPDRASRLLTKAADGGYRRAQYTLAMRLLESRDGGDDALGYMRMAAERGLREARSYLDQA